MMTPMHTLTEWQEQVFTALSIPEDQQQLYLHAPSLQPWSDCPGAFKAVHYIQTHLQPHAKICVVGDYDADGITATVILTLALQQCGFTVQILIPDRIEDGYGLKPKLLERVDPDIKLIVTVDNGIAALDACTLAKAKGFPVIVTDHHLTTWENYQSLANVTEAIVHARYKPEFDPETGDNLDPTQPGISGACTAWKLYLGLQETFKFDRRYDEYVLQLAAISVVSDVMPLGGANLERNENRRILKLGLQSLNTRPDVHLSALLEFLNISGTVDEKTIGYYLAPALNASGRLAHASIAVDALLCRDETRMKEKLWLLVYLNKQRKELAKTQFERVDAKVNAARHPIVLFEPNLNEGIVGILAGRLAEKYQLPALVLTTSHDPQIWKGSGRSPEGVNLYALLEKTGQDLIQFGGHPKAAGFSVPETNRQAWMDRLHAVVIDPSSVQPVQAPRLKIRPDEIEAAQQALAPLRPFGEGFVEPELESDFLISTIKYFHKSGYAVLASPFGQEFWLYQNGQDVIQALNSDYQKVRDSLDKKREQGLSEPEASENRFEVWKNKYGSKPKFHLILSLDGSVQHWTAPPTPTLPT